VLNEVFTADIEVRLRSSEASYLLRLYRKERAAGEQATIALKRAPRREFDQTVEVWFAPALGYLPVRIRITDGKESWVDLSLESPPLQAAPAK
jgi:hypothetical protein